jgi:hypothetical protein
MKNVHINPADFTINKQEINQTEEGRMFQVAYSDTKICKDAPPLPKQCSYKQLSKTGEVRNKP